MKAAGQDPAEARANVKAWEHRKSDFVLNRTDVNSIERQKQIAFSNQKKRMMQKSLASNLFDVTAVLYLILGITNLTLTKSCILLKIVSQDQQ